MSEAPELLLPHTSYYSIEYPGYIQTTSVPFAIQSLGGQIKLDRAFRRATSKPESLLELSLRLNNSFAHQIPGEVVSTNNIVLRIVKRKRKNVDGDMLGEYTAEAVGVVYKTVRFRSLCDFQYLPSRQDPVSQLRTAMNEMNVEALRTYVVPQRIQQIKSPLPQQDTNIVIDPTLVSNNGQGSHHISSPGSTQSSLRLFPPPLFSRQAIPQGYNFRSNSASMETTVVNGETGEEKRRLINRMRWRGFGPATIMFHDSHVPDKPPQVVNQGRDQVDQKILQRLNALFKKRPVWTRMSLLNQFPVNETREIMKYDLSIEGMYFGCSHMNSSKLLLPLVCYVFQDGPWRDTLVRFGYDPRKDPSARLYQRLYFRNANHPIARPSVTTRRQERVTVSTRTQTHDSAADRDGERSRSHIFDGKNLTKETAAFQLCDIEDEMLKEMIMDPNEIREECNERDGWFTAHAYEHIKMVLRHKFFSLLENHVATDEECRNLLTTNEGSAKVAVSRNQRLRAGKHNMAKGALRPEDAAAVRLRALLDRNTKSQTRIHPS
ncbi:hypothetical protein AMATHDRAFT_144829 [Amanita thiersii Skay4041]|uniref:Transcription factor IIIC subunit Tfc1/Sfc1 triple barrel domain-containing protein n=1 Tax=Amanita thiersii Skay4041 TaxID=703135 RepID=A0A2A9NHT3_9AGAR|nr:hypothetical protein AMATHDRAFT_144829 [Amanita thiersii Skay4041]